MADVGDFIGNLIYNFDTSQIEKGKKEIDNVGNSGKNTQSIFDHFVITLGDVENVFNKVIGTAMMFIRAYGEAEENVNKLSFAMKKQGIYTEESYQENIKFAEAMQKTTKYEDDAVVSVMSLLTTFGLHDEQLRKTTKTVLDLNAAMDIDLRQGSMALGKAFVGETDTLSRLGIQVDHTTDSSLKFDGVMSLLNGRVSGFAESTLTTTNGKLEHLNNSFNDVKEKLGKELIPAMEIVVSVLEKTNKAIDVVIAGLHLWGKAMSSISAVFKVAFSSQITVYNRIKKKYEEVVASYQEGAKKEETTANHLSETKKQLSFGELENKKRQYEEEEKAHQKLVDKHIKGIVAYEEVERKAQEEIQKSFDTMVDSITNIIVDNIDNWSDLLNAFKDFIIREILQAIVHAALTAISGGFLGFGGLFGSGGLFGFDEGGIVPGPIGKPMLAVVHGGETIQPTHKKYIPNIISNISNRSNSFNFNITGAFGSKSQAKEFADIIYRKVSNNVKY